jgi:TolA-binding protein
MIFASTLFVYAEPSVYGFGTEEPTENVETTGSSNRSLASLQQQIAQQEERIDGLTTIIEGLSASIHELQQSRGANASSMEMNDSTNTALLKKLAAMIDEINANYVSKEELQNALGHKSQLKSAIKTATIENASIQGKSNAKLYSEAVRYFVKKRYDEAEKRFTITDTKGIKLLSG